MTKIFIFVFTYNLYNTNIIIYNSIIYNIQCDIQAIHINPRLRSLGHAFQLDCHNSSLQYAFFQPQLLASFKFVNCPICLKWRMAAAIPFLAA